jgi:hypothetical protein
MRRLDEKRPYGTIWGHSEAGFEQDGLLFGFDKICLDDAKKAEKATVKTEVEETEPPTGLPDKNKVLETDAVDSARRFLTTILANGPVAKTVVFSEAQKNNQDWTSVKEAAAIMDIQVVKQAKNKPEQWALKTA